MTAQWPRRLRLEITAPLYAKLEEVRREETGLVPPSMALVIENLLRKACGMRSYQEDCGLVRAGKRWKRDA